MFLPAEAIARFIVDPDEEVKKKIKLCGSSVEVPVKKIYRLESTEGTLKWRGTCIGWQSTSISPIDEFYVLSPGYYILVLPRVKFPIGVEGLILPRSSLLRLGVTLHGTKIDSGFEGDLAVLMIVPPIVKKLRIEKYCRIAHIIAWIVETEYKYEGTYQGSTL